MRFLLFFCLMAAIAVSCNTDTGNIRNSQYKAGIDLTANNGFNDSASQSFADVYNTAYLIHDVPGYFLCYFYDSIFFKHDSSKDSSYLPQLSIHLNNLQSEMFSVTINFTKVNLENVKAKFYYARRNYNEKPDTAYILIDSNTRHVTLDSLKADASGYYYLNVFGICQNKNLWFDVSEIKVNYKDSTGK